VRELFGREIERPQPLAGRVEREPADLGERETGA
jgi:hypothetical protein